MVRNPPAWYDKILLVAVWCVICVHGEKNNNNTLSHEKLLAQWRCTICTHAL